MPWVSLWSVIAVFPGTTHLFLIGSRSLYFCGCNNSINSVPLDTLFFNFQINILYSKTSNIRISIFHNTRKFEIN